MAKSISKSDNSDEGYAEALRRIEVCRWEWGQNLDLSGLSLTTLPPQIGQLMALTHLFLHTNHLSTLPPEIGNLTTLRSLYLHENKLHTLPPEIAQLTSLTSLFLDFNELNTLPPEIGRLARLERLTLANNALTKLPESLVDLRSLEVLILHGNKALGLPIELLGPRYVESRDTAPPADPEAILDFYFSRQAEGEEPMREVRLLLVGRGRVGKTSLLKALRGESADKQEPETPGINVLPLDLNCAHGTATGHVWDFGG